MKLTILEAGWVLAAMAIGAFVAGARARSLAARLGAPRVVTVGLLLELVAAVFAAIVMPSQPSSWLIAGLLAVYGLGLGLASAQLTSTVLRDMPVLLSGAASATQSAVRQLGSRGRRRPRRHRPGRRVRDHGTGPARPGRRGQLDDANTMIDYMTGTAGAVISMIRKKGNDGFFGDLGPAVADQLDVAFAQCVSWVLWVAAAFILAGLFGALAVERASRTTLRDARRQGTVRTGKAASGRASGHLHASCHPDIARSVHHHSADDHHLPLFTFRFPQRASRR